MQNIKNTPIIDNNKIISLCMERQFFTCKADEQEYLKLYRDTQPGQNVYWNGFGQPPTLSFRADFDDLEFNRKRQNKRELIKVRLGGGNLGWIVPEDLELFIALYQKPLKQLTFIQSKLLELFNKLGPLNIRQIKEETCFLVKEITPALHKLQEAFLIYEDQYDGEWDRSWYPFEEMFPDINRSKYTRVEAIKIILHRFAYRHVCFDIDMAKSFYKLPAKEIKSAIAELVTEGALAKVNYELNGVLTDGYILTSDLAFLKTYEPKHLHFVYAIHRNDFLYKSNEHILKVQFKPLYDDLKYDHEPLQYLLIDGEFHGVSVGHFRNGPYDLNDVICDLQNPEERKDEIIKAIKEVNFEKTPERFMGNKETSI